MKVWVYCNNELFKNQKIFTDRTKAKEYLWGQFEDDVRLLKTSIVVAKKSVLKW